MNFSEKIERELGKEGYAEVSGDVWELETIGISLIGADGYDGIQGRDEITAMIERIETEEEPYFSIDIKDADGKVIYEDECRKEEDSATSAYFFGEKIREYDLVINGRTCRLTTDQIVVVGSIVTAEAQDENGVPEETTGIVEEILAEDSLS